ncbi:unnamed protein product [Darwinula stevensoni]|uniref:Short-chain dehydrogenase/reductase 3 n=1 Tax=Darwinula stevensoni TaxID=69355 RepID=A0A7R8XFH7_9CRUS|nr:unnamed protein product [Darwinula stevensoni]CAG0890586.1 unnamed protein product [Darwinula stevensoni]
MRVTGAAHGMGKEMALKLSEQGAIVVCWDISQDGLNETVKEIEEGGGKAVGDVVDVSDREQVLAAAQRVRDQVGDVTMLFNNAGIISCKPLLQHSHKELHRIFNVNVFSQFYTLEAFLPQMLEMKKGHVIAMSSAAGVQGAAFIVPYSSSKFAVTGLMDSLHEEVRYSHSNSNVKFTTVHPFIVSTGLVQAPRIRFNSLTPITSPKKAVETIIDGVLRDREVIFVPSYGEILYRVAKWVILNSS